MIELNEDDSTNPGIFGKSLATWIGNELVAGFSPDNLISEDFGWLVPVANAQHRLYVACSSTDETAQEWQVFVFAEGGLLSRLLRKGNHTESVAELYASVRQRIESEEGITSVREEE